MGLNKFTGTPCGFAFVEYFDKQSAKVALKTLMGKNLNGKEIRVDMDIGFEEGRQYGRGKNGYQKRDEMRKKYDPDRPIERKNKNYENDPNKRNNDKNKFNNKRKNNFNNKNQKENNSYNNNKTFKNKFNNKNRERSRSNSLNKENS